MQTVGALEHLSYNEPGTYSYEQLLQLIRRLGMGTPAVEQQFRRMVFNVVARNQDDHVKNIAFLMDRDGAWALTPAYDVIWAWQPGNPWLESHQMSINGKRDGFTRADLRAVARSSRVSSAAAPRRSSRRSPRLSGTGSPLPPRSPSTRRWRSGSPPHTASSCPPAELRRSRACARRRDSA